MKEAEKDPEFNKDEWSFDYLAFLWMKKNSNNRSNKVKIIRSKNTIPEKRNVILSFNKLSTVLYYKIKRIFN